MKFTVPVPAVNVPDVTFNDPLTLSMLNKPPFRVPLVSVTLLTVCVKPLPRFSVPPAPLMVSAPALAFTLPVSVAVPLVLVMVTKPVVVKPAMLFVVTVPLNVTAFAPKLSVPPPVLDKLPWTVRAALAVDVPVPLKVRL